MTTTSPQITGVQHGDRAFRGMVLMGAVLMIALLVGIILLLYVYSQPAIERYGFSFLVSSDWDPVFENFGAAPYIFGTMVTSVLALLLATPFAVGAALFISPKP